MVLKFRMMPSARQWPLNTLDEKEARSGYGCGGRERERERDSRLMLNSLVASQGVAQDLHPTTGFGYIARSNLVETNDAAGRIIQLIVVDLMGGEGGVKGEFDIRDERRKLQRHRGCNGDDVDLWRWGSGGGAEFRLAAPQLVPRPNAFYLTKLPRDCGRRNDAYQLLPISN